MKLKWKDVEDIFEEASIWENGHDMYWYRLMWSLIEYKNMNEYEDEYDRMRVYSRAFAIVKIYTDFIDRSFNENDDIFISSIDVYSYEMLEFLYDNADVHEIFTVLNKELGTRRTFYSMFITCIEFENDEDYELCDEYDELQPYEYSEMSCEDEYDEEYDDEEYDDDEEDEDDDDDCGYSDEYEYEEDDDEEDEDDDDEYEDYSEDYYETFEEYLLVLKCSSMSMLNEVTPEKAAGFLYLANNMRSDA